MSDTDLRAEVARLTTTLAAMEERLARLEARTVPPETPAPVDANAAAVLAPPATGQAFSAFFTRIALVCFALVGALVLRVATQAGLIAAGPGTAVGLAYCAGLLVVPHLGRRRVFLAAHGHVLQVCGALLAPAIILEMVHRRALFSPTLAAVAVAAIGIIGTTVATLARRQVLAVGSLTIAVVVAAALGPDPTSVWLRAPFLVAAAVVALYLAHSRGWRSARPWVLGPAATTLGLAALMVARRPELGPELTPLLCGALGAVWLAVLVNHWGRRRVLATPEAAWLALLTPGVYGVLGFAAPTATALAAPIVVIGLALAALWLARTQPPSLSSIAGLAAAATLLGLVALAPTNPPGIALAGLAILLDAVARRAASNAAVIGSELCAATAAALATTRTGLLTLPPPVPTSALAVAALVAAALFVQYALSGSRGDRDCPSTSRWLAPVALLAGIVVAFLVARAELFAWLGDGHPFQLAQSALLAVLANAAIAVGRARGTKIWLGIGVAGMALLGLRVIAHDLFALSGGYALAAVVVLGMASVTTSILWRRRNLRG